MTFFHAEKKTIHSGQNFYFHTFGILFAIVYIPTILFFNTIKIYLLPCTSKLLTILINLATKYWQLEVLLVD
jgi:hypothetical protein